MIELIVFYAAFLAAAITMINLTFIAYRHHDGQNPHTLSQLSASQERILKRFRGTLWVSSTLFSVSMYGFVIPLSSQPVWLAIAWTIAYFSNFLLSVLPARAGTARLHNLFAKFMAISVFGVVLIFWQTTSGGYHIVEAIMLGVMSVTAILTFADKPRYIFYELSFIYASHFAIIAAVSSKIA